MLVLRRNAQILKDHRDHEHIVRAQRELDDVRCDELDRRQTAGIHHAIHPVHLSTKPEPVMLVAQVDEHVEAQRHHRQRNGEFQRLPDRHNMRLLVEDAEVNGEDK